MGIHLIGMSQTAWEVSACVSEGCQELFNNAQHLSDVSVCMCVKSVVELFNNTHLSDVSVCVCEGCHGAFQQDSPQ